jgi:hypothetical protein
MTETSGLSLSGIPAACTLPSAEQPIRVAELNTLLTAAIGGERLSERRLRLVLTGPGDFASHVRDLVAREADCCSFFTFVVAEDLTGRVVLDVEVQAGYTGVLDGWASRARLASEPGQAPVESGSG